MHEIVEDMIFFFRKQATFVALPFFLISAMFTSFALLQSIIGELN